MISVSSSLTIYLTVSTDVYLYEIEFLQKICYAKFGRNLLLNPQKKHVEKYENFTDI